QELVDEVALGAHDLHAVITGLPGQRRAVGEVADLLLDTRLVQLLRRERVDRRLHRAGRDLRRVERIPPRMEDLQADLAAGLVHRLGDYLVLLGFLRRAELGRALA